MPPPGTNSQAEAAANSLPLFRPEAMAAHESLHGEILLIRPLSLAFLTWLGIGLGVALLALLLLARVQDAAPVTAVLLPAGSATAASQLEASLDVPSSLAPFIKVGTSLVIRCPGCNHLGQKLTADVIRIENSGSQTLRATIALPPEIARSLGSNSAGSTLEAEIPTGRTSIIHWLLKPSSR